MPSFASWYIRALKSHPFTTNMVSGGTIMLLGDGMAQRLEHQPPREGPQQQQQQQTTTSLSWKAGSLETSTPPRITLTRRRDTVLPNLEVAYHDEGITVEDWRDGPLEMGEFLPTLDNLALVEVVPALLQAWWDGLAEFIRAEWDGQVDLGRSASMALWAGGLVTPYTIYLYILYERYLPPGRTALSVGSRVACNYVAAIPQNAAFFCYGTIMLFLRQAYERERQRQLEEQEGEGDKAPKEYAGPLDGTALMPLLTLLHTTQQVLVGPEWKEVAAAIQKKLEAELPTTLQTSAMVWIPFNLINFSIIPVHMRALASMSCASLWNCYLSMAQHRDCHHHADE